MRKFILALLFFGVIANGTLAQTVSNAEFKTYQQQQIDDLMIIKNLDSLSTSVLERYQYISLVTSFDRSILYSNAEETLCLVNQMRDRGRKMFLRVEQNYNRFCIQALSGPFPCSTYRSTYVKIIADTLTLGGIYFQATKNSSKIYSFLKA